jgi:hypothetical protein
MMRLAAIRRGETGETFLDVLPTAEAGGFQPVLGGLEQ